MNKGGFTLPGESGYEKLTLELAERWGADVIRDSDGTQLSDEILGAGYGVYSTICPIREHNDWIRGHMDARQQAFLCTQPCLAEGDTVRVPVMRDFFAGQFEVNDSRDAMRYWQVYDRTANAEVPRADWRWHAETGEAEIRATPWHLYTVSFLAWRVWEEISMYNHVTNGWDKEYLMQLNPYHPGALDYLRAWLAAWCEEHPRTTVVRFTSLFYNFAWIWGSDERNRSLFADWASYDFTVCPSALDDFEKLYGYALTAEDFVRGGKYCATHSVPGRTKTDWMAFIGAFVRGAGRALVDIVHGYGKQAYVFYDDSWVGMEPYSGHFEEFGFDGIIKCVFSGYEARLCAGVNAKTHELRFHPYLFPVGLGGLPTFSPGGDPAADAMRYWVSVRRALLRQQIERTGLGGYLHLVQAYPAFLSAMDTILKEFRAIAALHGAGAPHTMRPKVGILHTWGKLRTWTLSGHFHETDRHVLIHLLESLSGLPFDVEFLSFDDVRDGVPEDIDVILNAGRAGDAWSGGAAWADAQLVEHLTKWVHGGGVFLGVGEPSAVPGFDTFFRMAHVLGVDADMGDRVCHGKWPVQVCETEGLDCEPLNMRPGRDIYLRNGDVRVLAARYGVPTATWNAFGKGCGLYLADYTAGAESAGVLQRLLLRAANCADTEALPANTHTECAVFPAAGKIVLVNNTGAEQQTSCAWQGKRYHMELAPYQMRIVRI